ncbi:g protein-coupled receptor [Anaeramoeba flamelloides]|uniref:G protein-coupled receptor n=1 Tax=Anaeramoeba flamelloides TaxID=1746091 RepID=A0AAV7ZGR2_9EUKA|nr:g protein-coupled receptor [Anaeramoeba flamelloides]
MTDSPSIKISITFLSLGIIGYIIIIFTYLKFKQLQNNYLKYLFPLACYDLPSCLISIIPTRKNGSLCTAQALLNMLFSPMAPFWCVTISFCTYLYLVWQSSESLRQKLMKWAHLFVWIVSLPFLIATTFSNSSPETFEEYCFYTNNTLKVLYAYYWLAIALCVFFYISSIYSYSKLYKVIFQGTKKLGSETNKNENQKGKSKSTQAKNHYLYYQLKTLSIPLVFIWCYFWPSLDRVMQWSRKKKSPLWIQYMHTIFFAQTGLILCLIFVIFSSSARKQYKRMFGLKYSNLNQDTPDNEDNFFDSSNGEVDEILDEQDNEDIWNENNTQNKNNISLSDSPNEKTSLF